MKWSDLAIRVLHPPQRIFLPLFFLVLLVFIDDSHPSLSCRNLVTRDGRVDLRSKGILAWCFGHQRGVRHRIGTRKRASRHLLISDERPTSWD
jgi:hypothetical protein